MIDLKHKYFLMSDGTILYFKGGINPASVIEVAERNSTSTTFYLSYFPHWKKIIFSSDYLTDIEEAEDELFESNPSLINDFYIALTKKKHTFPCSKWKTTPREHIKALINLNRISLVEQLIAAEEDEKEKC